MSYLMIRPGNPDRAADPATPRGRPGVARLYQGATHSMTSFPISVSRGRQLKLALVGALAVGVLATMTGRGTLAYFTTQVRSDTNTFTAGTLQFHVGDTDESNLTPAAITSISFATMKPGDVAYAPSEIDNVGSPAAQSGSLYTTSTSGTNPAPATDLPTVRHG